MIGFNLLQELRQSQSDEQAYNLIAKAFEDIESKDLSTLVTKDLLKSEMTQLRAEMLGMKIELIDRINQSRIWIGLGVAFLSFLMTVFKFYQP